MSGHSHGFIFLKKSLIADEFIYRPDEPDAHQERLLTVNLSIKGFLASLCNFATYMLQNFGNLYVTHLQRARGLRSPRHLFLCDRNFLPDEPDSRSGELSHGEILSGWIFPADALLN